MKRPWWRTWLLVSGCVAALAGGALLSLENVLPSQGDEPYSLIEDRLYLGAAVDRPPRGTQAVLNLCERADTYQAEDHVWEPIADAEPAPTLDWLRQRVDYVDSRLHAGKTVYVHCRAGVSRSGMVVTAYVMFARGWTRDEALAFVRSRRPIVRPNPAFMQLLEEWEQALKQPSSPEASR
jgi:hypothetical protein